MESVPFSVPDGEPIAPTTSNWKLVLSYDGTDYHGWQVQPGHATIQGELANAIARITGEQVLPQGSGRTDAGVHALAQVASFALQAPIPPANLLRALNRTVPAAIRVLSAQHAAPDFHARHSATGKSYIYRVLLCDPFQNHICPPWLTRFVYAMEKPLDLEGMQQASSKVIGEHDFTSFAAFDPDRAQRNLNPPRSDRKPGSAPTAMPSNVRTIHTSSWSIENADAGPLLIYRVTGNGFLHHMVRNLVGTFLEVGLGQRSPGEITAILAARDRSAAGRTAPARGLFLENVEYPAVTPDCRSDS